MSLTAYGGGDSATVKKTDAAPTASNLSIANGSGANGIARVGDNLEGRYDYSDAEGATENSALQWYKDGSEIANESTINYQVMPSDKGAKLTFEVTPGADTGTKTGTAQSVDIDVELNTGNGGGNTANSAPTLNPVIKLSSMPVTKAVSGDMLTAVPNYADAENDQMDPASLKFKWFKTGTVANIGTNPTYTVVIADEGSSITVEVSAKAKTGNPMIVKKTPGPVTVGVAVINDKAPVATIKPTTGATGPNGTALVDDTFANPFVLTVVDANGSPVTGSSVKTGDVITATYTFSLELKSAIIQINKK